MTKWLKIGAALLLLAWAPFVYQELTSEPAEKKGRALPSVETDDDGAHPGAGGGVAAAPVEPPSQPAAEPESEPEPEPAAEQPAPAPEQPAAAPEQPADPRLGNPPAEPDPEPEPLAEGDEEAEEEAVPPPVAAGPTAVMKQAYDTQPRDALWAKDTEARIAHLFTQDDMPQGMLERSSCRRAVCRIDVRWKRDTAAQYVSVFQSLREQFAGEVAVEPVGQLDEAAGQQQVHLYVLRKGYTASDLSK